MYHSVSFVMFFAIYLLLSSAIYKLVNKRALYPLHMLQLEGYNESEYRAWIRANGDKIKAFRYKPTSEKTPLVMTDRATRLYKVHCHLNAALIGASFGVAVVLWKEHSALSGIVYVILWLLIYYFQYVVLIYANRINYPREMKINQGFYDSARYQLR